VAVSLPILTRLLLQKPIVLTFALAQFVLGLALLLALVPARWWLGSGLAAHPEEALAEWPEHLLGDMPTEFELDPALAAAADQASAAQANGQAGTASGSAPGAGPGTAPGAAQPQPGAEQSQSSQQPGQQPGTPAAPGQSSGLQDLAEPIEEELLESLSDVSDILASFLDDEPTDPLLTQLSASLEDIEITALAHASRRMAHELAHSQPRRPIAGHSVAGRPNKPVLQRQRV
jgi:hypothetical protein